MRKERNTTYRNLIAVNSELCQVFDESPHSEILAFGHKNWNLGNIYGNVSFNLMPEPRVTLCNRQSEKMKQSEEECDLTKLI